MHVVSRKVGKRRVWYGVCWWFNPATGEHERDRKSTRIRDDGTAASRKRAEAVASERERRLGLGLDRSRGKTIAQAFVKRAEALSVRGAPRSTRQRAKYSAAHLFEVLGPDTPCASLTTPVLVSYAARRLQDKASADTVRRELSDLRAACTAAGEPCPPLPELAAPRVVERWLTVDECQKLLAAAPPKRARVIALVLLTALRKQEVFHLVRIAPGVGRLRETEESLEEGGLKTGERTIPLTPAADAILAEGPLEPWTNQGRDLKRYARKAGLGRVTWNDLRATPATQLLLADVAPARIAALLGHTSNRMIERRYARLKSVNVSVEDLASLPAYGVPPVGQESSPSHRSEPAPAPET